MSTMTDHDKKTGKHHAEDAPAPEDTKKDPKHTADKEIPQQGPETIEETVDEWGEETFPASDPPANY
jgi:hypothetical protein